MKRTAQEILNDINPVESKKRYEDHWKKFVEYSGMDSNMREPLEEDFLQYFDHLKRVKEYAASTMWSVYSMLNKTYQLKYGKKMQSFPRLQFLLKSFEKGYIRKTANVFTKNEIENFLNDAPNTGEYIHMKAAVVLCYFGGLRCCDLVNMNSEDFEFEETTGMWIKYRVSKQKGEQITNTFNVPLDYCGYLETYDHELDKCGAGEGRIMKTYRKNKNGCGYYTKQPMGIHFLRKISVKVAEFLQLQNPETYTGHALRRSSATALAETGTSTSVMKKHFNWKNESTALKYIENTKSGKLKISDAMKTTISQPSTSQSRQMEENNQTIGVQKKFNFVHCNNIVLNF